ncbi:hypothetical protein ACFFH2_02565 [Enterococcus devriesei]|uniref:Uncharacterized protein n=1 Tax=Enterococcus devriesei TaxID=319970 RepID=A0A1L8SP43_9ENTE|nr:hypothetical protein [Enterococcus devriesei]OJG33745.1 hypothetical protein RV00_GL000999 [Enterococcus devriesei]
MAEKKQEAKGNATTTKDAKTKVVAKSNSGTGTTLKVNLVGVPKEIIHGEILELTEDQVKKLKMASSSWSYDSVDKKEETK